MSIIINIVDLGHHWIIETEGSISGSKDIID